MLKKLTWNWKIWNPRNNNKNQRKIILNEEEPTKHFFLTRKAKANIKKHIRSLQNEQWQLLKTNFKFLKEWKSFFQTLYLNQTLVKQLKHTFKRNLIKGIWHTKFSTHKRYRNNQNKRSNLWYGKWEVTRGGWATHRIL